MNKLSHGYTLLEMLVTLAIVAILAAVAMPSFDGMLNGNKQKTTLIDFLGELHYVRSEAVKRSRQIMICPSIDALNCSADANWSTGWIAFIDDNRDNAHAADEELLRISAPLETGLKLSATTDIASAIRYLPNGLSMETGTFTLCDPRGQEQAKAIIINATGRPKIADNNETGGALTCN